MLQYDCTISFSIEWPKMWCEDVLNYSFNFYPALRLGWHIFRPHPICITWTRLAFSGASSHICGPDPVQIQKWSCVFFRPVQVRFLCQIRTWTADWKPHRILYRNRTRIYVNPALDYMVAKSKWLYNQVMCVSIFGEWVQRYISSERLFFLSILMGYLTTCWQASC